jgi:hypothetical protein
MDAAGNIPISPETLVGPTLVTAGVAARIPKLQLAPNAMAPAGDPHATALVVNVDTLFAASLLPNVSATPVVTVAVYVVFNARLPDGVKVATDVAEL